MTTLIFRALDQHVVGGLADHPAISDAHGTVSYAQLLHESASVAGALVQMGVRRGAPVVIDLPDGRHRTIAVLASARLGAVPGERAVHRFDGMPPVFSNEVTEVPWDVLVRAGRTDPAAAPDTDDEGYEQLMRGTYGDVLEALLEGGTLA